MRNLNRFIPSLCFLFIFASPLLHANVDVVATIRPLQFIAQAILGEHGSARSLIQKNDSAHHFNITPANRLIIDQAQVLVWIGPEFEVHIGENIEEMAQGRRLITSLNAPGLKRLQLAGTKTTDGHIWLSTHNALAIAQELLVAFKQVQPDSAMYFETNYKLFSQKLEQQRSDIFTLFAAGVSGEFIVYHNGFQYFEEEFGLKHIRALVNDPEVSPAIRDVIRVRNAIADEKPSCLLKEFDANDDLIETFLDGYQIKQRQIDLLGFDIANSVDAYFNLISHVAEEFSSCISTDN